MSDNSSILLGFEEKLWMAADKLRNNLDAAEYKHVVLGLIFLKYISDAFEEQRTQLISEGKEAELENIENYLNYDVFWVPEDSRWSVLSESSKFPSIGEVIDNAMNSIEKFNPSLRNILPKNYARNTLDKQRLGELVELIGTIGLGDSLSKSKDVLGRVYEYFLSQFASAEGKKGGQFYTPPSIVKLLVHMLEPYHGKILDPCCGSGGMFVQSENFLKIQNLDKNNISIFGQESNPTTWKLCKMNMAIRDIQSDIGFRHADSFKEDLHKELEADFVLSNPPFNDSDWGGEQFRHDPRWKFGIPPIGNANFAWVQHFIHHLSKNGVAGFVLANGSLSSDTSTEGDIRKEIIKHNLVDCIIALPGQLFYSTPIPACIWIISKNRIPESHSRNNEILFLDARKMGILTDRVHRELTPNEVKQISEKYHVWKNIANDSYSDVPGFCKSASFEEVKLNDFVLTPGRYVDLDIVDEDQESFDKRMQSYSLDLKEKFKLSDKYDDKIRKNLKRIGYG